MYPHEMLRPRLGTLAARYRVGLTRGCPAGVFSGNSEWRSARRRLFTP